MKKTNLIKLSFVVVIQLLGALEVKGIECYECKYQALMGLEYANSDASCAAKTTPGIEFLKTCQNNSNACLFLSATGISRKDPEISWETTTRKCHFYTRPAFFEDEPATEDFLSSKLKNQSRIFEVEHNAKSGVCYYDGCNRGPNEWIERKKLEEENELKRQQTAYAKFRQYAGKLFFGNGIYS